MRVFRRKRLNEAERRRIVANAVDASEASEQFLTLAGPRITALPAGFVHDRTRSEIGRGANAFALARDAFVRWRQFDLGWVAVVDPAATIAPGQIVGVEAQTGGVWSLNVCRIQDTIDIATRFGFLYATTTIHVEEGQERFVLDFEPDTQAVCYSIEAVSRPRHPLVWLAYPLSRRIVRRFF